MAAWPSTLPQLLEVSNFTLARASNVVETTMDTGPSFRRMRSSAVPQTVSGTMDMTKAQYQTMEGFYSSTLGEGVLSFTWTHPVTGDAATMRFAVKNPYQITALGGIYFTVSLSLEILP